MNDFFNKELAKINEGLAREEAAKKEADQLMMNKIEKYEKEIYELKKQIPMIREEVQIELLKKDQRIKDLETINQRHQKQVGELIEDNKKLAKQVQDKNEIVEKFRKAGIL
jgi:DNA repair ATPase RecN|tara:strand:+ start:2500 stop:2832 length:333 start_codon:yes stop_codon:yes gene_type:complete